MKFLFPCTLRNLSRFRSLFAEYSGGYESSVHKDLLIYQLLLCFEQFIEVFLLSLVPPNLSPAVEFASEQSMKYSKDS